MRTSGVSAACEPSENETSVGMKSEKVGGNETAEGERERGVWHRYDVRAASNPLDRLTARAIRLDLLAAR